MEPGDTTELKALNSGQNSDAVPSGLGDLAWAIVKLRAGERLTIDKPLIAAFQAASSPHTLRALRSDLEAFDLWCRRTGRITLPATSEVVADYLDARAGEGSKPASLSRYRALIARVHKLLDIADPTAAPLVRLRLAVIRKAKGVAQAQARPLRFKGPVRDVAGDVPRGLNIRALLDSCPDDIQGLRDRALLSTAYDTGLRAAELCAVAIEHLVEAIDPEGRLLRIPKHKGDQQGEGATAFLSPRSVAAILAWTAAAEITAGALFRRVQVRRYKARPAAKGRRIETISGREIWDLRKTVSKPAMPARVEYDIGEKPLHPGSIGPLYRAIIQRATAARAPAPGE